jgi:hypothetical protein
VQNLAATLALAETSPLSIRHFSARLVLAFLFFSALWFILCRQLSGEWSVNEQYNYGWFVRFHKGEPFNFGAESARLLLSQSLEIRDFISEKAMELDNQARQATSSAGAEFISPEESASRPARLGEI